MKNIDNIEVPPLHISDRLEKIRRNSLIVSILLIVCSLGEVNLTNGISFFDINLKITEVYLFAFLIIFQSYFLIHFWLLSSAEINQWKISLVHLHTELNFEPKGLISKIIAVTFSFDYNPHFTGTLEGLDFDGILKKIPKEYVASLKRATGALETDLKIIEAYERLFAKHINQNGNRIIYLETWVPRLIALVAIFWGIFSLINKFIE